MTCHDMQRDRNCGTFLIHFILIHRLALPGTTRSLTAMLSCMIAPGLDSSSASVFSHSKHPSLICHLRSRACQEPVRQRAVNKLLDLLVPATLAFCQGLTFMPYHAFPADGCISQNSSMLQVSECTLHMPSIDSRWRCSKLSSVSSVQTNNLALA